MLPHDKRAISIRGTMDKKCSKCGIEKPQEYFHRDKSKKDGHCSYCIECSKENSKKYHEEHVKEMSEYGKAYHIKHKDEHALRMKEWYQKNRNNIIEKAKVYYKGHIEKFAERYKRYSKTERGKKAASTGQRNYIQNHPERKRAHGAINNAVRHGKMKPASDFICVHCYNKQAEHYHHYKGYDKEHWLDVIPVCATCHKIIDTHAAEPM